MSRYRDVREVLLRLRDLSRDTMTATAYELQRRMIEVSRLTARLETLNAEWEMECIRRERDARIPQMRYVIDNTLPDNVVKIFVSGSKTITYIVE